MLQPVVGVQGLRLDILQSDCSLTVVDALRRRRNPDGWEFIKVDGKLRLVGQPGD